MTKISIDISDPGFKMTNCCNSTCVGVHTYMCFPIFTYGELNLAWMGIFSVEYDRETGRWSGWGWLQGVVTIKEHRVRLGEDKMVLGTVKWK